MNMKVHENYFISSINLVKPNVFLTVLFNRT